jgi:hypothetical protein
MVSGGEYTNTSRPFVVLSARKTPFTLDEAISLPELHLPSCGSIFPYMMQSIAHWGPGVMFPGFCVPNFIKTHNRTHWLARIHFMSTKKLIHFDSRNTPAHTGYSQGMLSIP